MATGATSSADDLAEQYREKLRRLVPEWKRQKEVIKELEAQLDAERQRADADVEKERSRAEDAEAQVAALRGKLMKLVPEWKRLQAVEKDLNAKLERATAAVREERRKSSTSSELASRSVDEFERLTSELSDANHEEIADLAEEKKDLVRAIEKAKHDLDILRQREAETQDDLNRALDDIDNLRQALAVAESRNTTTEPDLTETTILKSQLEKAADELERQQTQFDAAIQYADLQGERDDLEEKLKVSSSRADAETQYGDSSSESEGATQELEQLTLELHEARQRASDRDLVFSKHLELVQAQEELVANFDFVRKQLDSKNATIKNLIAEMEILRHRQMRTASTSDKELQQLQMEIARQSSLIDRLTSQLVAAHAEVDKQGARVQRLQAKLDKASERPTKAELLKARQEIKSLTRKLEMSESALAALRDDLRNATAEVEHARDLRVEIEQLRANAAELEQAHEDAISEIADQLRQAEQDFESVKSQLSASYDARETMESQLDALKQESASTVTQLNAQIDELRTQYNVVEAARSALVADGDALDKENQDLQEEVQRLKEELSRLVSENEYERRQSEEFQSQVPDLMNSQDEGPLLVNNTAPEIEELRACNVELQRELDSVRAELENLDRQEEVHRLQEELSRLFSENEDERSKVEQLQARIDELENSQSKTSLFLKGDSPEVEELRSRLFELQQELDSARTEAQTRVELLENQLQEAEERRVELLLEINVLKEHTASPQEESAGNLNGNIKAVPNGEVPDAKLRDSFSHVTSFEPQPLEASGSSSSSLVDDVEYEIREVRQDDVPEELLTLRQSNNELLLQIEALRSVADSLPDGNAAAQEIAQLKSTIEGLELEANENSVELERLRDANARLQRELKHLQAKNDVESQLQIETLEEQVLELEHERSKSTLELNSLREQVQRLKGNSLDSQEASRARETALREELRQKQLQLDNAVQSSKALQKKLHELSSSLSVTNEELASRRKELGSLQEKVALLDAMSAENKCLRDKLDDVTEQLDMMKSALRTDDVQAQLADRAEEVETLRGLLKEKEASIKDERHAATKQRKKLEKELASLREELEKAVELSQRSKEDKPHKAPSPTQGGAIREAYEIEISGLKQQITDLTTQLQELKASQNTQRIRSHAPGSAVPLRAPPAAAIPRNPVRLAADAREDHTPKPTSEFEEKYRDLERRTITLVGLYAELRENYIIALEKLQSGRQASSDKEPDTRSTIQAAAKSPPATSAAPSKPRSSSLLQSFTKLFRRQLYDENGKPIAIADMTEDTQFVYDPVLKKYVDVNAPASEPSKPALPPPRPSSSASTPATGPRPTPAGGAGLTRRTGTASRYALPDGISLPSAAAPAPSVSSSIGPVQALPAKAVSVPPGEYSPLPISSIDMLPRSDAAVVVMLHSMVAELRYEKRQILDKVRVMSHSVRDKLASGGCDDRPSAITIPVSRAVYGIATAVGVASAIISLT
ncbi:unnamed protein product (mitochondrion) [Plasmodiophora brassicae]|uniref:Uncharacterized protein n=1 Tax=Plasmodiophora brassicae TaxID=37360 RepID=A0A3P3Y6R2_PLABS|nr:unnamed protein product [Plasmodiophora brassicae]